MPDGLESSIFEISIPICLDIFSSPLVFSFNDKHYEISDLILFYVFNI